MQAILLHWFAAQRIGLFHVKFSAEFNELSPEILEYLFWKMQENSMETSVVVYIDLILAKNTPPRTAAFEIIWERRRDGFLFFKCSDSKMLG